MLTLVFAATAALASDFAKISAIVESPDRNYVFINAHRGLVDFEKGIPENSLASIRYAVEQGMDIVEVDPKTTRDGRVILSHENKKLDRLMVFPKGVDGQNAVADIPYEGGLGEVCFKNAKLRLTKGSPIVTEERPCLWEELLDAVKGKCYVQVDCTYWNCMPDWRKVWDPVVERGMEKQICFKTGDRKGNGIMPPGKEPPPPMRGYFWGGLKWKSGEPVPEEQIRARLAEDTGAQRIQMQPIGRYGHDQAGEYGDRASIDFDPRVGWDKLLDFGATVIMTDYGVELRRHLEKRGRRTAKPKDVRTRVLPPFKANCDYDGSAAPGLYSETVALPDAKNTRWTDGTDGKKTVWWRVRPPVGTYREGDDFLGYLKSHRNVVAASPVAAGGDVILKFREGPVDRYVHVFADTAAATAFEVTSAKALTVRVLAVGGGGGAGHGAMKGPWGFGPGGGGDGGAVAEKDGVELKKGATSVTVGAGGAEGASGGASAFGTVCAAKGGAGGADGAVGEYRACGNGAGTKGALGTHVQNTYRGGGDGVRSDILGEEFFFGGGGAAGTHARNGGGYFEILGGKGGGGLSSSTSYAKDKLATKHRSTPGTDGLGGGGAGGEMKGAKGNLVGNRGGSGVVIVSYRVDR